MTNFQFSNTVPAAGNDPSSDQPLMLINNQSLFNYLNVDHIGFNANNGGTFCNNICHLCYPRSSHVVWIGCLSSSGRCK